MQGVMGVTHHTHTHRPYTGHIHGDKGMGLSGVFSGACVSVCVCCMRVLHVWGECAQADAWQLGWIVSRIPACQINSSSFQCDMYGGKTECAHT